MTVFNIISLFGGLALFLFGMNLMSTSLEKRTGGKLKSLLANISTNPIKGFLLGILVTVLMQSSSATTVMVVGFVNSGLMTLSQSVSIIVGANLGASITPWILSLSGMDGGGNVVLELLKISNLTPVVAFIGAFLYLFNKKPSKKDTGMILLGFAVLMYGMENMSSSVSGLSDLPQFTSIVSVFSNPIIGVLAGTFLTAIIQSSSASIGILQALAMTGSITYGTAIPVIMGQNIGTCISALLSCIGTSKNAKRAAIIHLSFNIISTIIVLPLYYIVYNLCGLTFADSAVTPITIAFINTVYKIVSIVILSPFLKYLEPLSRFLIRDGASDEEIQLLDERLLNTPSVAIERCRTVTVEMAELSVQSIIQAFKLISSYDEKQNPVLKSNESKVDYYEDQLGTYLVKLSGSSRSMTTSDSTEVTKLLHMISDYERISDHSINILMSAEEIYEKKLRFTDDAQREIDTMISAVTEVCQLALAAFRDDDLSSAVMVEPLEQVVDNLKEEIRRHHIARLRSGECTIEMGFILTDLLTNMERVSDHCSNIAGYMLEMSRENVDIGVHEYLHQVRSGNQEEFNNYYDYYKLKYSIPELE